MRRSPIPIIEVSGTPCEVAFALGKLRRRQIEKRVGIWNALLDKLYRGKKSLLKRLEEGFWQESVKQAPHYLEEIRAMAEGAGVPVKKLFRLNCTELNVFAEKCTTLILPVSTDEGQRVMIAHNEDWNPARNDVFVLKAKLPQVNYVILTYDGYLPGLSCGFNSWGLYHAVNYVRPKDMRIGLPRIFITRHLVTAPDFEESLKWIQKTKRAFGQSIHLAMGKNYLGLELTAKKVEKRSGKPPLAHANHYLANHLLPVAAEPSRSSTLRQIVADSRLKLSRQKLDYPCPPNQAVHLAKSILSERTHHPYCIWREADHQMDESATVATVLMQTGSLKMKLFRKKPSTSPARIINLR